MRKTYKFTEQDDIVAFYLYKWPDRPIGFSVDEIGEMLGMGAGSMKMRIGNFVAVDAADGQWPPPARGKKLPGLPHYARQSAEVYRKYKDSPEAEIRQLVVDYLATRPRRTRL